MTNASSEAPLNVIARQVSPDETLTLVVSEIGDDVLVGFDGMTWHTHGDVLAQFSGLSLQSAVDRFVQEILRGQHPLALLRQDGVLVDAWVTDDPEKDAAYAQPGDELEFRYWDGTKARSE